MAKKCSYNKSYFSRLFKEYTGLPFTAYLKNVRIRRAALMIKESDKLIEEIITDCGYTDKTKFFKHFKACYGVTPLGYRKK
jgi:AraC-like DNA-binding protein